MKRLILTLAILLPALMQVHGAMDFSTLETQAIQEGGRKKPFSTFATETLQTLSGRAKYKPQQEALQKNVPHGSAMEVVTAIWFSPDSWENEPLILLNYKPLREELGLNLAEKKFSYKQLASDPKFRKIIQEAQTARQRDPSAELSRMQKEAVQVANRLSLFEELKRGEAYAVVPNPQGGDHRWGVASEATHFFPNEKGEKVVKDFEAVTQAYKNDDATTFVATLQSLTNDLNQLAPEQMPSQSLLNLEHQYFNLHPFRIAWILFATAGIFLLLTAGAKGPVIWKTAWIIVFIGSALLVYGFVCRVLISGRAPVTNMYESVIWVAFGTTLFGLIFAAIYKSKTFLIAACPLAVITLILADTQPTILNSGIHPLVPVLRDNFWLTTHVLSITLSYAALFLALGVAHIVLGRALFRYAPSSILHLYLYRCIQIGVLLLGAGTILGGVWANYSWGRFWDWDPKETWALIAFLAYMFVLHGRLAGYWGGFGLAIGSVIGFMSVVMAWYGVNFVLGTGLHSYGFGTGGFGIVIVIVAIDLLFMIAAIVRHRSVIKDKKSKSAARKEANL